MYSLYFSSSPSSYDGWSGELNGACGDVLVLRDDRPGTALSLAEETHHTPPAGEFGGVCVTRVYPPIEFR